MNFHSTTNSYKDDRYSLILQVEEGGNPHLTAYNDGLGFVTIGVGFNLSDANVRDHVFTEIGITNTNLINQLTSYLTNNVGKTTSDSAIQTVLDGYMAQYMVGTTFSFANENQVKNVLIAWFKHMKHVSIIGQPNTALALFLTPKNAWYFSRSLTMVSWVEI